MEQKKIWDHFQVDPLARKVFEGAWPRYYALSKEVSPHSKVLNIGIGSGGLEELLYKKIVNVYSLDPSEDAIALVQNNFTTAEQARVGMSDNIPWEDDFFDVVIMSEVLEHLDVKSYGITLLEVLRVLRPGGKFVFTVPADENLLENQAICPCCGVKFHRWGHVQSFTEHSIRLDISPLFCHIQLSRRIYSDWSLLNWKGKFALLIKRLLSIAQIKSSGETFFVVAHKPA